MPFLCLGPKLWLEDAEIIHREVFEAELQGRRIRPDAIVPLGRVDKQRVGKHRAHIKTLRLPLGQ